MSDEERDCVGECPYCRRGNVVLHEAIDPRENGSVRVCKQCCQKLRQLGTASTDASKNPPDDGGPWYPGPVSGTRTADEEWAPGVSVRMRVAAMFMAARYARLEVPMASVGEAGVALERADVLVAAEKRQPAGPTVAGSVDLLSACRSYVQAITELGDSLDLTPLEWSNLHATRNLALAAIEKAEKE